MVTSATGYAANDTVSIQVYAYRVLPNGITIYSANAATSSDVTSNDVFTVSWTWDAVAGATRIVPIRTAKTAADILCAMTQVPGESIVRLIISPYITAPAGPG